MVGKPLSHETKVRQANCGFEVGLSNSGSIEAATTEAVVGGNQNNGVKIPTTNFGIAEAAVNQAFAGRGERREPSNREIVETEAREAELKAEMEGEEQKYLERYRQKIVQIQKQLGQESDPRKREQLQADLEKAQETYNGLKNRYESEQTGAEYVLNQLKEFAAKSGIDLEGLGLQLADQNFEKGQVAETIKAAVLAQAEEYFTSEKKGTKNPKKHEIVQAVLDKMIDYIAQAITDGEMPPITDRRVYQLVMMMFVAVLYQDRAATENLLGDHGIRHVWGHNITMCEKIADSLASHGQTVTAMDRFMMMLTMTYHDLGYAMDPVRYPINQGGFGADAGHGVLAAKCIREIPFLAEILPPDQIRLLHKMVLTHDYTPRGFIMEKTPEARAQNMLEAIRVADNTHAFEDKLPELLFAYPKTLLYMKLIEVAIKSGASKETIEQLKKQLQAEIKASNDFSEDDKQALANAVSIIGPGTAKFTVGRICGHQPEISVDAQGGTTIEVEESEIHRLVVGIFGQQPLDQLRKFAADLTGQRKEEINLDVDSIGNDKITIKIKTEAQKLGKKQDKTDYQLAVETIITDQSFQEFLTNDNFLVSQIKDLENQLENTTDSDEKQNIEAKIASLKKQRLNNLGNYLQS